MNGFCDDESYDDGSCDDGFYDYKSYMEGLRKRD
jgi:hypothetical protein